MKVYIVLSGSNEVLYRGSWYGCLHCCGEAPKPLRIAVMRAGDPSGHIVAEVTDEGFKLAENKTSVSARHFSDG